MLKAYDYCALRTKEILGEPLTEEEKNQLYEAKIIALKRIKDKAEGRTKMYKTDNEVNAKTGAFQGDVGFVPAKIPKGAKKVKSRILALGEATGHHHVLTEEAQVYELAEELFFKAGVGAKLLHQEHDAITIAPGTYRVIRQVEYDGEEERRVMD